MSVDFTARETASGAQGDAGTFAPTPVWAREPRKRRGLGARRANRTAAAPMTPGQEAVSEPMLAPDREFSPAMTSSRPARARNTTSMLVAGSVAVIAAAAFAGWYATRPTEGVAEMTPGAPAVTVARAPTIADTSAAAPAAPATTTSTQLAAADTTASAGGQLSSPPASAHAVRTTPARASSHHATRARSSTTEAAAAADDGVNASAVESGASPAYSGSAQTPAPMTVAPNATTPAPMSQAPAAPAQSAPAQSAPSAMSGSGANAAAMSGATTTPSPAAPAAGSTGGAAPTP